MSEKISCGGFKIDNNTLIEEDGVLKVVGGSGSDLPPYTDEDLEKVLTIKRKPDPSAPRTIIVQEQTIEATQEPEPGNFFGFLADNTYDFSTLSEGDHVVMTINGQDFDAIVSIPNEFMLVINSDGGESLPAIARMAIDTESASYFVTTEYGTYVISCSTVGAIPAPEWVAPKEEKQEVLFVRENTIGGTLNYTWNEIREAGFGLSPKVVILSSRLPRGYLSYAGEDNGEYDVYFFFIDQAGRIEIDKYTTDSADGYPVYVNVNNVQ